MLSVVIPAYGHRDFVLAAVGSALTQEVDEEVEVIVVDDGSPDDTGELLAPLAEAGRIRLIRQENRGQAAARNRGIREARGRYVALLDDDDEWPPGSLAARTALLDANPGAVLAYGDWSWIDAAGDPLPTDRRALPSGDVRRAVRACMPMLSVGQALFRAEALRAAGGFDEAIFASDDWDLLIRLAERGPFVAGDFVALHYRRHGGNTSSRAALRHARAHLAVAWRHIGADLPLMRRHLALASTFFVPRLLGFAAAARARGAHREARRALLMALLFRPSLVGRRHWLAAFGGAALRRRPSTATVGA